MIENTGKNFHCGWVALMGAPNAGKSSLLNAFLGQKVAIVTPKPQTTRNQIVGIYTDEDAQIIFMDTPGLSQMRGHLSKAMLQAVWQSLTQANLIMPVIDAHLYILHPEYMERDLAQLVQALSKETRPLVVVANKVDMFGDKSRMLPLLTKLHDIWPKADIFPVSALQGEGVAELKSFIKEHLPVSSPAFPEDQVSTASLRFMAAEIIREKLFLHLRQEVPYGVAVDVESWEEDREREITVIHAVIYVSRDMHKAMVIGKNGSMIKEIGTEARRDIQELVEGKVHLELWVKVKQNWTEDAAFLREMGLRSE